VSKRRTSDDLVIHETENIIIEWFWTPTNEMPGLDALEKLPSATQARFAVVAEHWGTLHHGQHLPEVMLNLEDAKEQIYAIKAREARFACFFAEERVIVTGHYTKQSKKLDKRGKRIVQAAAAARKIYREMVETNTYYNREEEDEDEE
jgi:hypothetical protein